MRGLRAYTPARVALGRAGHSIPTHELLEFQLAHARARDAVHLPLDGPSLMLDLKAHGITSVIVSSSVKDRREYLRRPDLGRHLAPEFRSRLAETAGEYDVVFVIVDGLSALAVHRHAVHTLAATIERLDASAWRIAPVVIALQGRVAIGDEIGQMLKARLAVVLIGERPGLSSPDSLGVYLTWNPRPGVTDADRNCISNIRTEGFSHEAAAHKVVFLMNESRRRKLSGVPLKEAAGDWILS